MSNVFFSSLGRRRFQNLQEMEVYMEHIQGIGTYQLVSQLLLVYSFLFYSSTSFQVGLLPRGIFGLSAIVMFWVIPPRSIKNSGSYYPCFHCSAYFPAKG